MDAEHALRAILRALILPPTGPILLAGAGLWLGCRRAVLGRSLAGVALALLLLLSTPVVASRLAGLVAVYPPMPVAAPLAADVIVVLGGGLRGAVDPATAAPGPATLERLAGAAAIARASGLPLLLSGGRLESGPAEAPVMQAALRASFGLEARFIEATSRDTHENALHSARILALAGLHRVVLVTSAVHMPRAVAEFRAAGLEVMPAPVATTGAGGGDLSDWLPRASALETSYGALYECGGLLVARLAARR